MPAQDSVHQAVLNALVKEGWQITDDPLTIEYGDRHVLIDVGAEIGEDEGGLVSFERDDVQIAVEIKGFAGPSPLATLEQAVGQYVVYNLLLEEVDPLRVLYLAVPDNVVDGFLSEPIGRLVRERVPLRVVVIDCENEEVVIWTPHPSMLKS